MGNERALHEITAFKIADTKVIRIVAGVNQRGNRLGMKMILRSPKYLYNTRTNDLRIIFHVLLDC